MEWFLTINQWLLDNKLWIAIGLLSWSIPMIVLYLLEPRNRRTYFIKDGKYYIQEGNKPPEDLEEHLRIHHPKEYKKLKEEDSERSL